MAAAGRLTESVTVTLNGAGAGSVQLGPRRAGEAWRVTRMTTRGTSTVEPVLDVRRGSTLGPVVDTTRRGNQAISETDLELFAGEYLSIVYAGGTAGARMSFQLEGEYQ